MPSDYRRDAAAGPSRASGTEGMLMGWLTARWIAGAVGAALLAVAVWGGRVGLGDPGGLGPTHLAALLVGGAALAAALAGRRAVAAYRTGAVVLVNSCLLLSCLELGAALVLLRLDAPPPLPGEASPYYREKPWAPAYWREFHALRHAYHPYFLWRTRPFHGRLISIDSDGLRATPGAACIPGAFRVDAFGGSTLWGWGEPDSTTLGAYLQAELARGSSMPVCVRNFGQLGSNSTQDLIQLLRELQAGRVPDLVVFYSGVNEIIPPYGYGAAGMHFDFRGIRSRVEGALDQSRDPRAGLRAWAAGSSLWRLVSRVGAEGDEAERPARTSARGAFISEGLADSIVGTFATNHATVQAMAAHYGFRYEAFWQPNDLVGGKRRTAEEELMRDRERIGPLVRGVYDRMKCVAAARPHLHDLSDVFAAESALVYLDWNHVNAIGNRVVAREIARALAGADRPASSPVGPAAPLPPVPPECLGHPAAPTAQTAHTLR